LIPPIVHREQNTQCHKKKTTALPTDELACNELKEQRRWNCCKVEVTVKVKVKVKVTKKTLPQKTTAVPTPDGLTTQVKEGR
jgi:hypothetical protein